MIRSLSFLIVCSLAAAAHAEDKPAAPATPPTYAQVHAVLAKHCLACHDTAEHKGKLVLDSHESLLKGGKSGPAIEAGKPEISELYLRIVTEDEDDLMPPPDEGERVPETEVALIREWIKAGAPGPQPGEQIASAPVQLPEIAPKGDPRRPVHAIAYAPATKLLAIGRHGEVELMSVENRSVVRKLAGHRGNINALAFSTDGKLLYAAAGEPGGKGEVRVWSVPDGKMTRLIEGHTDAVYSLALSPDNQTLATGSYDQLIILWNAATGEQLRTLKGHNGAVFDLVFRPDGKVLASASADWTLKLWAVADGKRLDTLSEPLKDLHTVAFSPDGQRVAAGGVDNRIRVWQVSPEATEGTNPILYSRFAHEGTILNLAFSADGKSLVSSADDRTVKVWDAAEVTARVVLEQQPDWPTALAFALEDKAVAVGRLDGSVAFYSAADGKILPPPAPTLTAAEPRGVQRGATVKVKLTGTNLVNLVNAITNNPKLTAKLIPGEGQGATTAWVELTAAADLPPGAYHLNVSNAGGAAPAPMVLQVDTIAQVVEAEPNDAVSQAPAAALPTSFWGALGKPGDSDHFAFDAKAGQTLVLDLAGQRLGSKADAVLTLTDTAGRVLATSNDFEGKPDPLIAYTIPAEGRYTVRVSEHLLAGSAEHFYRLSIGEFAFVTGAYPLGVPANAETQVQLTGYNLPPNAAVVVKAAGEAEVAAPIDPNVYRTRAAPMVVVGTMPETLEAEPNDLPAEATVVPVPGVVNGRVWAAQQGQAEDADVYRFESKAGQQWVIETLAARRGSPVDTKIELLHPDGKPVERLLLRAVRDSTITFRPLDANEAGGRFPNYEEMKLNEYIYMEGEVVKLLLAPRGPDSVFNFYTSAGKRRCFFDTSATTHPLDTRCYVVEPHPPGTTGLPANGLPSFPLYYANDDDGDRELGSDSRVLFTAPAEGAYLVRVTDTRGFGGDRFAYRLILRHAQPGFAVRLEGANPAVPAGAGKDFTVVADRIDGFEGPIRVDIQGLPPGFSASSPLYIEASQDRATGVVYAAADAPAPTEATAAATKVTATASVNGQDVVKEVNSLGKVQLAAKPQVLITLTPDGAAGPMKELTIAPGQTIPAMLRVERNGLKGVISFDPVTGLTNLPHGVIIADLGLNALTLLDGQNEQRIFFQCAPNTEDKSQAAYAVAAQADRPTSAPLVVHVRKPQQQAAKP